MSAHHSASIDGTCSPAFDRVRDAFEANFRQRDEIGASVAVWVDGQLVVNLWGGTADAEGQRPWQHDTLVSIFSGSKALTSTCIHLLADRGELDLNHPSPTTGPNSPKPESRTSPSPRCSAIAPASSAPASG